MPVPASMPTTQPALLDTHYLVYTPEGIALRLRAAGPWLRAVAWLLDTLLRGALLVIAWIVLRLLGEAATALFAIVFFLVLWFYPVWFEVRHQGQTPGKRWMKLRVISANGAPIGWRDAISRNFMRTIDMLPLLYVLGLVISLLDPASRRLGDLVAGTLVVHAEAPAAQLPAISQLPQADHSQLCLPALSLTQEEQQAIITFMERSNNLSPERREELASLLVQAMPASPLTPVDRIGLWAARLLGR